VGTCTIPNFATGNFSMCPVFLIETFLPRAAYEPQVDLVFGIATSTPCQVSRMRRSTCLCLAFAAPAVCVAKALSVAQVPIIMSNDPTTSIYRQWPENNTIISAWCSLEALEDSVADKNSTETSVFSPIEKIINSSLVVSSVATGLDVQSTALDKSFLGLVIFGVAGLCLL
jgi:hypothetical protein